MKNYFLVFISILTLTIMLPGSTNAQSWTFIKEKNGIELYTHQKNGKGLKTYKGVTEISASADKVFAFLEDLNHIEWWTKEITNFKLLHYEKNNYARCYFVFNLPWPFKNRDLCVNIAASINPLTGVRKLTAAPLKGIVPENDENVRIKDFREIWTVESIAKNKTHLELEYYIDPCSDLPDWLINMVMDDAPIDIIKEVIKNVK